MTELETLVIRLTTEVSGAVKGFDQTRESVEGLKATVAQLQERLKAAEDEGKKTASSLNKLISGVTTSLGALGAKNWLQSGLANWTEAEQATIQLESAIKANGGEVDKVMVKYDKWAGLIQDTTKYSDEQAFGLLKTAETFELSGDAATQAAEDAMALGSATGGSAEAMIRMTAAVKSGNFEMAQRSARMIPQLRGVKNLNEFQDKYNKLLKTGQETQKREADTATVKLTQLANAYSDLMEDVGKLVADAIKPFVGGLKDVVKWLRTFDDQTKMIVVSVAAVSAGVLALVAAFTFLGPIIAALSTPVLIFIAAAVAVGAAIAVWVKQMGGVEKAWDAVKQAGMAAWDWLEPIRMELGNLWDAIVEAGTTAWESLTEVASVAWSNIVGDATVDWEKVRSIIQDVLIAAEFGIRNFGKLWDYVVAGVALKAEETWGTIEHFFTGTLPALLNWFRNAWIAAFQAAFSFAVKSVTDLGGVVQDLLSGNFVGAASKAVSAAASMAANAKKAVESLPPIELPVRLPSAQEQQIRKDFEKMGADIGQSFEDFRAERLWEQALWGGDKTESQGESEKEAEKAGKGMGDKLKKGAVSEVKKLDAVLFGSAEALSRIDDYFEKMKYGAKESKGGPAGGRFAQAVSSAGAEDQWEDQEEMMGKQLTVLEDIRRQGENKVNLEGAKFG